MTTEDINPKHPPREGLCRSVPFESEHDDDGDGLTFRGYGAVFNSPTRIDSWEGCFDEQIAPGAFRKSLRERKKSIKFQFDHGQSTFGSLPCGTITDIYEDDNGLHVEARMSASPYWEPLREAIASGAVDGMSFRFSVVRDEWRDRDGKVVKPEDVERILYGDQAHRGPLLRTLKEVKISEVGPVVWPAYESTTASLRSKFIDLDLLSRGDPEQRKLFARAALMIRAAEESPEAIEGDSPDSEPQDTTSVAVEHSDTGTDSPRSTDPAGEHESVSVPDPDADRLFADALAEVRNALELNPPITKG